MRPLWVRVKAKRTPPGADWILVRLGPRGSCEDMLGDLHEEFAALDVNGLNGLRACCWYWRQVGSALVSYRLHRRAHGMDRARQLGDWVQRRFGRLVTGRSAG